MEMEHDPQAAHAVDGYYRVGAGKPVVVTNLSMTARRGDSVSSDWSGKVVTEKVGHGWVKLTLYSEDRTLTVSLQGEVAREVLRLAVRLMDGEAGETLSGKKGD